MCFAAFDMRGHGKSSESSSYQYTELITDTQKVLEALVVDRSEPIEVFLVGHSLGASVLAALPEHFKIPKLKFSGLVMIDIIEGTTKYDVY